MSTVLHQDAVVGPDGKIEIAAAGLRPGQRVRVTIEATTPGEEKRHAIDLLAEMPGHRLFKTAEEVDAYLREERDAWDR